MNTLADRLRLISQELTALKTSHKRGLGALKIYTKLSDGPGDNLHTPLTITINFSKRVAPYPLFQIAPNGSGVDTSSAINATYGDGGYRVVATAYDNLAWSLGWGFWVLSTASIESITWSR